MNLTADDVAAGVLRDRAHAGSSMADIEPMAVDRTVSFLLVNIMLFVTVVLHFLECYAVLTEKF